MSDIERFWSKVKKGPGCWEWQGHRVPKGYGYVSFGGKHRRAPRVSWEIAVGPIPDGLIVMHMCSNPPCVRPHHLVLGTTAANVLHGRQRPFGGPGKVSFCMKGHPLTDDNAYPIEPENGYYCCRICRKGTNDRRNAQRPRKSK